MFCFCDWHSVCFSQESIFVHISGPGLCFKHLNFLGIVRVLSTSNGAVLHCGVSVGVFIHLVLSLSVVNITVADISELSVWTHAILKYTPSPGDPFQGGGDQSHKRMYRYVFKGKWA